MKLFEFEAKEILKNYDIAIANSKLAVTPEEAEAAARELGGGVFIKSQIQVSGRGKAGGIKPAKDPAEAKEIASQLLGHQIKGITVEKLLVEEKIDLVEEYYASITVDRQAKSYIVLASTSGGMDIEQVSKEAPEKIVRFWVDPLEGMNEADVVKMIAQLKMSPEDSKKFVDTIMSLYKALIDYDAELVELNPLVKVSSGAFMAADARLTIDDNAVFRHPEFGERSKAREEDSPREAAAREKGLAYVELDGDVGIIGNGAGLVMSTLDVVSVLGGKAANFLDIGGGAQVDIIKEGMLLVLSNPNVKSVLVNILGGITRCDLVAQGVVEGLKAASSVKPVAVRMMGTNEAEGAAILKEAGIGSYPNMEEAAKAAIKA